MQIKIADYIDLRFLFLGVHCKHFTKLNAKLIYLLETINEIWRTKLNQVCLLILGTHRRSVCITFNSWSSPICLKRICLLLLIYSWSDRLHITCIFDTLNLCRFFFYFEKHAKWKYCSKLFRFEVINLYNPFQSHLYF